MKLSTLNTDAAPSPAGAYSQGRRIGPFIQISGQVPASTHGPEDIEGQTTQALRHVHALLDTEGLGWGDVLMLRVFLADDRYWEGMDAAFQDVLEEPYPPRTAVSAGLAPGVLVEIDALAATS